MAEYGSTRLMRARLIKPFINKMVAEIEAARVTAAIVLTHSYTDTEWFHKIGPIMQALCFTNGRVAYTTQTATGASRRKGKCFSTTAMTFAETFDTAFSAPGAILSYRNNETGKSKTAASRSFLYSAP